MRAKKTASSFEEAAFFIQESKLCLEFYSDPSIDQASPCIVQDRFHTSEVIDSLRLSIEYVTRTQRQVHIGAEQIQATVVISNVRDSGCAQRVSLADIESGEERELVEE